LGGSHYYKIQGQVGANVPKVDLEKAPKIAERIGGAIAEGLVCSCHDCSEGGLAVALAEMAFAGGLGIEADLRGLPKSEDCVRVDAQLFSESNSRYIVEVEPDKFDAFVKLMLNLPFGQIGKVTEEEKLVIKAQDGRTVIESDLNMLKQAWQKPLDW
jgi:phosphoribosylformylglycinamidine synthase